MGFLIFRKKGSFFLPRVMWTKNKQGAAVAPFAPRGSAQAAARFARAQGYGLGSRGLGS